MPKVVAYALTWSYEHQEYVFAQKAGETVLDVVPESPAWFAWLEQISSFAFSGKAGRCTIRKENKQRGDGYWYAYQSGGKQLAKRYVGKTSDLTLARLEAAVEALAAARSHENPPPASPVEPVPSQPDRLE